MASPQQGEVELGFFGWMNRVLVVLIVLAVLAGIGMSYLPLIQQNQRYQERVQRKQADVERLDAEIKRLDTEIRLLKTDSRFLERKIRELGYAKADEWVVTFKDGVK